MPLICVDDKCCSLCGSRALGAGSSGGCCPLLWMRLDHGCLHTPTPVLCLCCSGLRPSTLACTIGHPGNGSPGPFRQSAVNLREATSPL